MGKRFKRVLPTGCTDVLFRASAEGAKTIVKVRVSHFYAEHGYPDYEGAYADEEYAIKDQRQAEVPSATNWVLLSK